MLKSSTLEPTLAKKIISYKIFTQKEWEPGTSQSRSGTFTISKLK